MTYQEERSIVFRRAFLALAVPAVLLVFMWSVFWLDTYFRWDAVRFGLLPRTVHGAIGIAAAPLLHGSLEHLVSNSIPMLFLGWCLFFFYPRSAWWALAGTWLFTGALVWASARPDIHIGASGVVYALAAFIFLSGVLRRLRPLLALSLLMVFLYGGMVWGVLPIEERVSWESHLWGGITGFALAWWLRKQPSSVPPPPEYFADEVDEEDAIQPADHADEQDAERARWMRELQERANRSTTLGNDDITINYPPL